MIAQLGTYRTFFIASMLFAYLAGTFQSPLLKVMHDLSHIFQELLPPSHLYQPHSHQGEDGFVYQHSHQGHQEKNLLYGAHSQQHLVLDFLSNILDQFSNSSIPVEDGDQAKKKKHPEQKSTCCALDNIWATQREVPTGHFFYISSPFLSVSVPPPKV